MQEPSRKTDRPLGRQLAELILDIRTEDISAAARTEATRALVNWAGCAVGGSRHEMVRIATRVMLGLSGPAQATLFGRRAKADMLTAAMLNSLATSAYAFDDTHADMVLHPVGPIASALMALAEHHPVSGREFLAALILGVEVECRMARSVSLPPAQCDIGWYMTGVVAGPGAAAACARVLGMDAACLVSAMAIASGQGSGYRALHGSMSGPMIPAHAAESGLRAALLAREGYTGSERFIEGPRGFLDMYSDAANPAALTSDLGMPWEIERDTYKPYPCGIVMHPVIDACLELRQRHAVAHGQVVRVSVRTSPAAYTLCNNRHPQTDPQAKVSLSHWVAAALVDGRAGIAQLEKVGNPVLMALEDRVEVTCDETLAGDAAEVCMALADGRNLECRIGHCIGSSDNPMSNVDLERKFRNLAEGILPMSGIGRLLDLCWNIESLPDVAAIAGCAAAERKDTASDQV